MRGHDAGLLLRDEDIMEIHEWASRRQIVDLKSQAPSPVRALNRHLEGHGQLALWLKWMR